MSGKSATTFPRNATATLGLGGAMTLAANKQGFGEADAA
jgi:hypothetical protein